jgi:hypothetical protein
VAEFSPEEGLQAAGRWTPEGQNFREEEYTEQGLS